MVRCWRRSEEGKGRQWRAKTSNGRSAAQAETATALLALALAHPVDDQTAQGVCGAGPEVTCVGPASAARREMSRHASRLSVVASMSAYGPSLAALRFASRCSCRYWVPNRLSVAPASPFSAWATRTPRSALMSQADAAGSTCSTFAGSGWLLSAWSLELGKTAWVRVFKCCFSAHGQGGWGALRSAAQRSVLARGLGMLLCRGRAASLAAAVTSGCGQMRPQAQPAANEGSGTAGTRLVHLSRPAAAPRGYAVACSESCDAHVPPADPGCPGLAVGRQGRGWPDHVGIGCRIAAH